MIEETLILLVVMLINLVMIIAVRIPLLLILFGFVSATLGTALIDVYVFPWLNILLFIVCIYSVYQGISVVRE